MGRRGLTTGSAVCALIIWPIATCMSPAVRWRTATACCRVPGTCYYLTTWSTTLRHRPVATSTTTHSSVSASLQRPTSPAGNSPLSSLTVRIKVNEWALCCQPNKPVTFPAVGHHRPQASTRLYCLVTEAHRCEKLAQSFYAIVPGRDSNPRPLDHESDTLPQHHDATHWDYTNVDYRH